MLCGDEGHPLTRQMIQNRMRLAATRAHVRHGVHILRHTFCSHLAMRSAPVTAIQAMAGHRDLSMTERYLHLSPATLETAIWLFDVPRTTGDFGDMVETATGGGKTINKTGP